MKRVFRDFNKQLKLVINQLKKPKNWPNFSQLRYAGKFLSKKEKQVVSATGAVAALAIAGLIFSSVSNFFVEVPKQGGTYREAVVGAPQLINPLYAPANEVDTDIARLVFSGLMRYNERGALVPDLAERMDVNDERTVYTFILRENVQWHDGKPLTAKDVLFTFGAIVDQTYASPLRVSFQGVTVSLLNENTVQFALEKPFAPFLGSLTTGIIPEHIWGNIDPKNARLSPFNSKPIGSGPFAFGELTRTESGLVQNITLNRSENFYDTAANLNTIVFVFYPTYETAVQDVRSKRVQGLHFVPNEYKSKVERKHITLRTLQLPQYTALFFNPQQSEVLKSKAVRSALSQSVDKQRILQDVFEGEGSIINSPILDGSLGYDADFHKSILDIANAEELLSDSGYKVITPEKYHELRSAMIREELEELLESEEEVTAATEETTEESEPTDDTETTEEAPDPLEQQIDVQLQAEMPESQTVFRAKGDVPLQLSITTVNDQELVAVADIVAAHWRELGIQVNVRAISPRDINTEVLRPRLYDVLLIGQIVGADPDPFPFWHSSQTDYPGLNLAYFIDRKADALLESARESTSDEERADSYVEFQKIIQQQQPAVFLYAPTYTHAISTDIQGVTIQRILNPADRFNDVSQWFIKTKRVLKK